ncbi:UNVERIFIED_CONTAM: hypothetical protein PYX00_001619 [Menopon gallinae]|uniref:Uncharacterized protein n=1 Tax=Menopon gallinae TaxID=328185 RepID=A0AAW2IDQ9_9NEOP
MGEPRIINIFKFEGWKRNKKKVAALCLLCFAALVSGLEEGDDSVNVISVENLDALLGLRMVTELNLKNLSAPEQRTRRSARHAENLCGKQECDCESRKRTVSCRFRADEVLDLGYGSLSPQVHHFDISNLTELRILPGAFLHNANLLSIVLKDISNITVGKDVFRSIKNRPHFNIDVTNCDELTLHEHSFSNVGSPLRMTIENCSGVKMKKSAFPSTLFLRVYNVSNLEMESYTFYVERRTDTARTTADMAFDHVTVKIVPSWSFRLSGARISFVNSVIDIIDKEAFRAIQLESVHFRRTTISRFESEAFSGQTSVKEVEFDNVNVQYVAGQALSATTNFTIRDSSINEISNGAFNVSTAFLRLTGNAFRKLGRHAFAVQSWNSIVIDRNEFESLKQDTFLTPFSKVENITNEFVFSDNVVNATEVKALSFVPNDPELEVIIRNNTFQEPCHCHLESWILTLSSDKWKNFYDTSKCRIGEFGSCYDLEGDYMDMWNYTAVVCGAAPNPDCEMRRVGDSDSSAELDLKDTEKTILGVIFIGVASSVVIMLFALSVLWMRQKGVFAAMRRYVTPSGPCCLWLCNSSNLVTSSSISRINIHEYAEIQYQMTEQQKQTILTMSGVAEDEVIVICEDKATQTLPEELTQELLQTLREKLDDPENYNEARNMIEHLYDLIKVEESCNNNNVSRRTSTILDDEDEEEEEEIEEGDKIYDVIAKKPRKRSKKVRKTVTANVKSTGTRAPSPDKLSPVAFNLPRATVVTEYAEPRDRKSNEYCELPGSRDAVIPDVLAVPQQGTPHLYAVPFGRMANRPLPSAPSTSNEAS